MIVDEDLSGLILSTLIHNYGIVDSPYQGSSFILPDGSFLNLQGYRKYSDVELFLDSQGLSLVDDYKIHTGSPTLKSIGCIRVNSDTYYIQLSSIAPTDKQYESLDRWFKFLLDESLHVEVMFKGSTRIYKIDETLLDKIKSLYK